MFPLFPFHLHNETDLVTEEEEEGDGTKFQVRALIFYRILG